ncbi:pyridoxamine 5'-phosphate oxidase family protein [Parasedimentitalea maritima]|uniref:Pyridoxamine 5-phosphate oxidase n=1 Tax=Parasedimentitalea maritima TaxID=2578117 RepID=A0A6A4RHE8_9RHOB|nr:pyridoxamine 5'-phosphate oxidase family protein [Zongyanglinia marina]KAE9630400.1 pyridoxamine 5-phosphate oxidase [Zongyanglinia marina]
MPLAFADIAFTPKVRAEQERRGSSKAYGKFLSDERWGGDRLGPEEAAFLSERDGFFQASVSESGWPYVQFRGGTPGFIKILDDQTIAYADYRGNRQYISAGNLVHSNRLSIIAMDYPNQRRLKLWGEVELIDPETDPQLLGQLHAGKETIERIVKIRLSAFDWNCPRHIPRRYTLEELEPELAVLRKRLSELEAENAQLKRTL